MTIPEIAHIFIHTKEHSENLFNPWKETIRKSIEWDTMGGVFK